LSSDFELLDFGAEFDLARQQASTTVITGRFMFLTQEDAQVDPEICEPLNRTIYDMNDLDIPTPPLHRHCRCRLIPLLEGQTGEEF